MRPRRNSQLYYIISIIFAQFAWMGLLGLWIYFYVSNYIIFEKVGDNLAPQILIDSPNTFVFVGGIVLIVAIAVGMSILLRNLGIQLKLAKMYDNFIANVTHELKSPLASIQLYLQTLKNRDVPAKKQEEFYDTMMRDAERLKDLINSILEISALEQKRTEQEFKVFEADEIFKRLIQDSAEKFKLIEKQLKFKGNLNSKCMIDPKAMQIVFDNLVDNSLKYSIEEAIITVGFSEDSKNIYIEFSDRGIGIPAHEEKKIFNKFYRIYNNESPNVKGTGLGLYRVREILKLHKGNIGVKNEDIKEGSTFLIELPIYNMMNKRQVKRPTGQLNQSLNEEIG